MEPYYMCDRAEGAWCADCFDKTQCGKGKHGEGCEVMIISDGKSVNAVSAVA
jgi:hypothetical protein